MSAGGLPVPTFTAPTVAVTTISVANWHHTQVEIHGPPFRLYPASDGERATAEIRAIEGALHAEWQRLQEQRGVCKRLVALLKARRAP